MDRRTLLMLGACLPLFSTTRAEACSVALKNPRDAGVENQQVRKLFEAWWDRDAEKFRGIFTTRTMADGSPMERKLAQELAALDPVDPHAYDIFDRFFSDRRKSKRITLIVNTDAGVIVACSEADQPLKIEPDCSGLPKLHLFAVRMSGSNPRGITHIATTETVEVAKFSIWSDGSA